ncbi:glycosyltransferase family 39 protein [Aliiroseovarius sp. Z3]|uniref:ArnT family glycosyltransferase n=1 Tax=Aliiroseovarius sp. Z3 TaxID=2811402 RepID=UPI0023B32A0B|nr:glycosyltransferase family 39 protein [Aliiroseovarius sp. Z3]MDE9449952.1 glycosyltransferase family 39 protein [Aliiroseovarius sp. Z3]
MKVAILLVLAVNTRFVMDEFWHFTQPVYLFDGTFETIWPKKAVGYALFYELSHLIGWDASSMLMTGRLTTACLALVLTWCIYRCARALGYERVTAILAVALLLSFSNFIERGFRLRSEPLATAFAALAVLVVIRYEADRAKTLLIAGLLCGLAFVTTQKSVYFNFALGAALVVDAICMRSVTRAIKRGGLLVLGWAVAIIFYGALLGGPAMLQVLEVLFLGPVELARYGGSYYEGLDAYVWQTLLRNPLQYGLVVVGFLLSVTHLRKLDGAARIFLVYTTLLTALVFFHNQTWPYVFTMALPFLAVYGAAAVTHYLQHSKRRAAIIQGILMAIAIQSTVRNVQYLNHDNHAQLALVRFAEAQLGKDDTYFDGIGMIPSRRMEPRLWLDAQGVRKTRDEGQSSDLYSALLGAEPHLVISTYRTDSLGEVFTSVLEAKYGFLSPHIMLPLETNPKLSPAKIERAPLFNGVYDD